MAEPSRSTLPQAGAGGRSGLLTTKLYVPRPQPGHVPRPHLLERLTEGPARGLVLVCAPAGFGKTALLADWARTGRRPVAWLSLDEDDNDPARFWRHVAAALDHARPGVAGQLDALLGSPPASAFEGLVTALINRLAEGPDQVLLVLDDYHLVESQPVHASLAFLLDHRPPSLGLVVASRADPPLPLARLRARGQLTELRAAHLRFTPTEAADLLQAATGRPLPEQAVAALATRTEGWAAGLRLAALYLQDQPDVAGFVAGFSGSHRYVLDYLTEEVLDRQPEPVVRFLLETSILDRLSGPLCDAVCGRAGSQRLLEVLERADLFLMPLDEVRGWWRYHQLVRRPAPGPSPPGPTRADPGAAPLGGRLVRGARAGRRGHPPRPGRRGPRMGGPADRGACRRAAVAGRGGDPAAVAGGVAGQAGPLPPAALPRPGAPGHPRPPSRGGGRSARRRRAGLGGRAGGGRRAL